MQKFSNVTIQCAATTESLAITLTAGVPSEPFGLVPSEELSFTLAVQAGDRIQCELTNGFGQGDADLYLAFGSPPDIELEEYDCASTFFDSEETCTVRNIDGADILWATVTAFGDSVSQVMVLFAVATFGWLSRFTVSVDGQRQRASLWVGQHNLCVPQASRQGLGCSLLNLGSSAFSAGQLH